jgi:magnesium-transporting ATPase (P-type)
VFSYIDKTSNTLIDCAIPFSSEIKFNLFIREVGEDLVVIMKGAPERILSRCTKILINGMEVPFDSTY